MVEAGYNLMENAQTSGLSLGERILAASCEAKLKLGKELKEPAHYKEKVYNLKKDLETQMKIEGKSAEDVINSYIDKVTTEYRKKLKEGKKSLRYYSNQPFLTDVLEKRRIDCVSAFALYITLSEMLDEKLYNDVEIERWWGKGNKEDHVTIRKKSTGEYINLGKKYSEDIVNKNIKRLKYIYREILPKDHIFTEIHTNAGGILLKSKNYKGALEEYFKALEIDPKSLFILNNIVCAYSGLKNYKKALICTDKILKIDPKYTPAIINKKRISTLLRLKEIANRLYLDIIAEKNSGKLEKNKPNMVPKEQNQQPLGGEFTQKNSEKTIEQRKI